MRTKQRHPLKTGFWFGIGFMFAAYIMMFIMDAATGAFYMLFTLIMKGLGMGPGMVG